MAELKQDLFLCSNQDFHKMPEELIGYLNRETNNKPYADFIWEGKKTSVLAEDIKNFIVSASVPYDKTETDELSYTRTLETEVSKLTNNSFDTFFNELKTDMREREQRTRDEINHREERFEKQLNVYTQSVEKRDNEIKLLIQEMKSDIKEEIIKSESRITQNVISSEKRIEATEKRLTEAMEKLEKTTTTYVTNIETMKNQNFWGNIAMFFGMLGVVAAVVIAMIYY